jgi:hypothetical protein
MTGMPTWVYSPYHRIVVHTIRICVCIFAHKYNYPVVDCQWSCWGSQFYMDPWSCVSSLCHLLYKLDVRPPNVCIFNWFLGWVRSTSHQGTTTAMRLRSVCCSPLSRPFGLSQVRGVHHWNDGSTNKPCSELGISWDTLIVGTLQGVAYPAWTQTDCNADRDTASARGCARAFRGTRGPNMSMIHTLKQAHQPS